MTTPATLIELSDAVLAHSRAMRIWLLVPYGQREDRLATAILDEAEARHAFARMRFDAEEERQQNAVEDALLHQALDEPEHLKGTQ